MLQAQDPSIAPGGVTPENDRIRLLIIGSSLVVGCLLMAVKFYAYHLTGSSAILSDALESIINVAASAFALGSVILSARPPDRTHPYGHGKIEYFSAGFEGALIILAALGIFFTGISHILHPRVLPRLETGLWLVLGAAVVNLGLGLLLVKYGRKTGSLILKAEGQHVLTDVYTSLVVLPGLLMVKLTGLYWLDGAAACLVGLNILVAGSRLVKVSFRALMDASDPDLLRELSAMLERRRKPLWIDIHQLRAWRAGNLVHVDLHLILPRDMQLEEAHREAKELETLLLEHFGGRAEVLIHMDPCVDPDCPVCVRHTCALRHENLVARVVWDWESLVMQGDQKPHVKAREASGHIEDQPVDPLQQDQENDSGRQAPLPGRTEP